MSIEWPEGLPRNYDELAEQYGGYIAQQVARYNKVDRNFEDLFQSIWLKLIECDVLRKFAIRASTTLPSTMTATEVCAYLGITESAWGNVMYRSKLLKDANFKYPVPVGDRVGDKQASRKALVFTVDIVRYDQRKPCPIRVRHFPRTQRPTARLITVEAACAYLGVKFKGCWTSMMHRAKKERDAAIERNPKLADIGRLPRPIMPIKGTPYSKSAVFLTFDVRLLEDIDYFVKRSPYSVRPKPTAKGFKTYLSTAIHHNFANFCRTQSRRYKEHLLPPSTIIATTASGYQYKGTSEEGSSWEGALVEAMVSAEDAVDVVTEIRRAEVDPNTEQGVEVLDYMARGYTIQEALLRSTTSTQVRVFQTG